MKKILSLLFFVTYVSNAQLSEHSIKLSDQAEISVVTCGPFHGEVYSAFGHSAFRVSDPTQGIDAIYNYGVFDYDQPNFYLNFALGKNKYMLGVQDYNRFRDVYIYYNRFIHEQPLNLNTFQKQKLFSYLEWNADPRINIITMTIFITIVPQKLGMSLLQILVIRWNLIQNI